MIVDALRSGIRRIRRRGASIRPHDEGRLLQVNVSAGGVPKLPVEAAAHRRLGVEGDRQASDTVHGGPHRAVSILGSRRSGALPPRGIRSRPARRARTSPTEGFDVSTLPAGTRLAIGDDVVLELSRPPTRAARSGTRSRDLRFGRLAVAAHPADSRMYARVLREGIVRARRPDPARAAGERRRRALRARRRGSTRQSARARSPCGARRAATAPGRRSWTTARSRSVPQPHASRTDLQPWRSASRTCRTWSTVAVAHFATQPDHRMGLAGRAALADRGRRRDRGRPAAVRHHEERGPWRSTASRSASCRATRSAHGPRSWSRPASSTAVADAWRALERDLALVAARPSLRRRDRRPPSAPGPAHPPPRGLAARGHRPPVDRGRGIQRALIAARIAQRAGSGCDLVGASAVARARRQRNLERLGLRRVAVRGALSGAAAD